MGEKYYVKNSKRKSKRDINSSIRKDIVSYLVELVTNSDDSYKRLEEDGKSVKGEIYIVVNKKSKKDFEISVIDFAEGMSRDTLIKVFRVYGNNNAGGVEKHVRGIFGQGASDVLKNASLSKKTAVIESICDGFYNKMIYKVEEDDESISSVIEFWNDQPMRVNDLLREKLGIWGNGTIVTFGVPDGVDFGPKVQKGLRDAIEKNPSFRYLLDEDYSKRKVYLYQNDKGGLVGQNIKMSQMMGKLSSYKYRLQGDVLLDKDITFPSPYGNAFVKCHLNLYRKINQEDEAKIIIRDENYTVFDDNSFGFRNNLQDIVGELTITGLYKICYDLLNRENNPETILNDNRTGFDKEKIFYKVMENFIGEEINKILESNKNATFSIDNNKEVKQAIDEINEYIKDIFKDDSENIGGSGGGDEPPISGIEFVNSAPIVTKGKKYGLKLLINSNIVNSNDIIDINLENNYDNIEVSPLSISYDEDDVSDTGLVVKNITIIAKNVTEKPVSMSAKFNDKVSISYVSVKDIDIHNPENGLEFFPNDLNLVFDKPHILKLYFNFDEIPEGSIINVDGGGLIGAQYYKVVTENIVGDSNIGMIDITLNGGNVGEKYVITASCGDKIAKVNITLIDSKDVKIANGPLSISGIKFDDKIDSWVQVYFNPRDGYIYINASENQLINKKFFGDYQNFKNGFSQWGPEGRRYICELVTSCVAKELVRLKGGYKTKNINTGGGVDDVADAIWDAHQKYKNELFIKFYKCFFRGPNSR